VSTNEIILAISECDTLRPLGDPIFNPIFANDFIIDFLVEKKAMGGEKSFRPLVRPHHSFTCCFHIQVINSR
jgi:hypothetical protein